MSRAPYNILTIPFKKLKTGIHFCVFKREDTRIWQFISGGGEDNEQIIESAKRESFEEAGIPYDLHFIRLKTMCYIPSYFFDAQWGKEIIVIPAYTYAVEVKEDFEIKISQEHSEYKWCSYQEAIELLHFDLDKTSIYEVNELFNRNVTYYSNR